jgi:DNA-binding HxlR family transcriptional regulator
MNIANIKSAYGQFCPVAKASEIFATRWTPLVVRELLFGSHTFNDIHRGVPLMSRALLIERLRQLEEQGIVEKRTRADGLGHEYWLTPAGESAREIVRALGHWGLAHTRDRISADDLDPALIMWTMRQRTDMCPRTGPGCASCGSSSTGRASTCAQRTRAFRSTSRFEAMSWSSSGFISDKRPGTR